MKKATEFHWTKRYGKTNESRGALAIRLGRILAPSVFVFPLVGTGCSSPVDSEQGVVKATDEQALSTVPKVSHKALCASVGVGEARCHAHVLTLANGSAQVLTEPSGYGPADLGSAYLIPTTCTGTATIAIVDAYDDPNAENDLGIYRAQYGLPTCTTANGCFLKVNQSGKSSPLPRTNKGWSSEIALDIEMASAVCPTCKIVLVEANSNSFTDLGTAVNRAASMGASVISNSYGGSESFTETFNDRLYFNHPGILVTASTGDAGYGVEYPAASPSVVGVGGTSLTVSSSDRGWAEAAWSGAGSGCSRYESKPSFQHDTGCSRRTVADVSAVADPSTGVAVYDSYGVGGWAVFGGTSVASPLVASVFACTGKAAVASGWDYSHTSSFYDVTTGANGTCGSYLCTSVVGYDGPTGLGTPNATSIEGS